MTGNIRTKLASSDAAQSLRMESSIADSFRSHNWPAQQGVYYTDADTGKFREIDVLSRHTLRRPVRTKGIGGPIINLYVLCECKSLSGLNILLKGGDVGSHETEVKSYWSGYEEHIRRTVDLTPKEAPYSNCNRDSLFSYYQRRAYPDEMELAYPLTLTQPPVDLVATAFRTTKDGSDENRSKSQSIDPVWNAIQSVLSSSRAVENRAINVADTNSQIFRYGWNSKELAQRVAFFYDLELARRIYFHPIIFSKARMFQIDEELKDVHTARLFIRNLNFDFEYIDLVSYDNASEYIDSMITHFEKHSKKAIRKTWDRLDDLGWQPGADSGRLSRALGVTNLTKKSKKNSRKTGRKSRSP